MAKRSTIDTKKVDKAFFRSAEFRNIVRLGAAGFSKYYGSPAPPVGPYMETGTPEWG